MVGANPAAMVLPYSRPFQGVREYTNWYSLLGAPSPKPSSKRRRKSSSRSRSSSVSGETPGRLRSASASNASSEPPASAGAVCAAATPPQAKRALSTRTRTAARRLLISAPNPLPIESGDGQRKKRRRVHALPQQIQRVLARLAHSGGQAGSFKEGERRDPPHHAVQAFEEDEQVGVGLRRRQFRTAHLRDPVVGRMKGVQGAAGDHIDDQRHHHSSVQGG